MKCCNCSFLSPSPSKIKLGILGICEVTWQTKYCEDECDCGNTEEEENKE